jgi:hypothetical protein
LSFNFPNSSLSRIWTVLIVTLTLIAYDPTGVGRTEESEKVIKDLHDIRIIKSRERPHDILNEACYACHPKEKFKFWLLIYEKKEPKLTVEKKLVPAIPAGGKKGAHKGKHFNFHAGLGCNVCHYENPSQKNPKFIVEVNDLCKICHPSTALHSLPEDEQKLRSLMKFIREGKLPGSSGEISCLTCHKIHESVFSMRKDYAQFLSGQEEQNPHGSKLYCYRCHPGNVNREKEVKFLTGSDLDKLCLNCHAKPEIPDSPHIWGVFSSEKTWKMDYLGYPLNRGKLTCQSCHDEVCYGSLDQENPHFLRGGPYKNVDDFCFKCHMNTQVAFFSPHRQIGQFGRIIEESCVYCHSGVPKDSTDWDNIQLADDEVSICGSCHDIVPHPGVNHLIKLPSEMKERKIQYEKDHIVKIPLNQDGTVQCSTCHNPHSKGVIKGDAGVGAGSKWRVADFKEVCAPCHGRY